MLDTSTVEGQLRQVPVLGLYIEPKKLAQVIAEFDIDLIQFKIYGSQQHTIEAAERQLMNRQALVKCYHFLTDDHRLALPWNACRAVVLGEIIRVWYEVSGYEVPAKVTAHQEVRMAKAKEATQAGEAGEAGATAKTKEPRLTNRSIIEAGLLAGKADEEIMKEVKSHFPNGKADAKHIGYYRHHLVKDGKLAKTERPPRAKKTTAEGTAEAATVEAAPAKVAAKAGTAQAAPAARPGTPKPGREAKTTAKSGR